MIIVIKISHIQVLTLKKWYSSFEWNIDFIFRRDFILINENSIEIFELFNVILSKLPSNSECDHSFNIQKQFWSDHLKYDSNLYIIRSLPLKNHNLFMNSTIHFIFKSDFELINEIVIQIFVIFKFWSQYSSYIQTRFYFDLLKFNWNTWIIQRHTVKKRSRIYELNYSIYVQIRFCVDHWKFDLPLYILQSYSLKSCCLLLNVIIHLIFEIDFDLIIQNVIQIFILFDLFLSKTTAYLWIRLFILYLNQILVWSMKLWFEYL
jgi:hypothetical protein